jgi:4-hydroxybenzoate polyprenyltransferase
MLLFKKAFDFYLNSSIHVGFAIFCLVKIAAPASFDYALLVFFGALFSYNFLKYKHLLQKSSFKIFKLNKILIVTIFAFFSYCFICFQQNFSTQIQLGFAGFLVFLYLFLRKIGWLKVFYVSFVICFVTLFIPLQNHPAIGILFLYRFLILSVLIFPFEIIDMKNDPLNLKTIPQLVGISTTKKIGFLLLILSYFIVLCNSNIFDFKTHTIISLIIFFSLYFSSIERSKYYSSFWVESIPIIWSLMT